MGFLSAFGFGVEVSAMRILLAKTFGDFVSRFVDGFFG
jgi:hypothetical protein